MSDLNCPATCRALDWLRIIGEADNAVKLLPVDSNGKAHAGLGLDAQGEVGLVLMSRDGGKTLYLSPDEPVALKLVDKSGHVLWGAP